MKTAFRREALAYLDVYTSTKADLVRLVETERVIIVGLGTMWLRTHTSWGTPLAEPVLVLSLLAGVERTELLGNVGGRWCAPALEADVRRIAVAVGSPVSVWTSIGKGPKQRAPQLIETVRP